MIFTELLNWLKDCPELDNYIYFNVIPTEPSTSIIAMPNTPVVSYIDGSTEYSTIIELNIITDYDTTTTDINILAMNKYLRINDWIKNNIINKETDKLVIHDVQPYYDIPDVYVNDDGSSCRYVGRYKIDYLERK